MVLLYYNIMGPPSYMRPIVNRNVGMRRMTVRTTVRSPPQDMPDETFGVLSDLAATLPHSAYFSER